MKSFTDTIKYIIKNFVFVFLFALIPACFVGGLLQPFSIFNFITDYPNLKVDNFGDILYAMYNMPWVDVFNWLFATILIVILLSALLGNIENHLRSGKLNLSASTSFVNNNLLATFVYFLFYIAIYLIVKFILSLFVFILHIIFGCLKNTPNIALVICVIILTVLFMAILAYVFAYCMIGLIDTLNSGYSFRTSLSDANEIIGKNTAKILLNIILPFVIVAPIVVLGSIYNFSFIGNVFSLIILFMYYPVLGYVSYYEYAGINRYDNIKRYYYR